MSAETAQIIHLAIWCVGILVWLFAVRAHRRAFRLEDPGDPGLLARREVDVDAPVGTVRDKLVEALRTGGLPGVGAARIVEAGATRIVGEVTGLPHRKSYKEQKNRFEIDLGSLGSRTAATYSIRGGSGNGLRVASGIFVYLLGPAVLAAAFILMQKYVVTAADPSVRAQAFQTFQVGHFLWPPFLFAALRRRIERMMTTAFDSMLSNTAF